MNIRKKIPDEYIKQLYTAISNIKNEEECEAVFNDLCTINEIRAMAQRLIVAKMLDDEVPYTDIIEKTGASSTTVSRVSRSMNYGYGGYRIILDNEVRGK